MFLVHKSVISHIFLHWLLFQRFTIFLLMFAGISPTTIYARVGDEASFNCSHTSNILPTSFRLNELTYRPLSTLPGYIHNTYIMGVLTVFFTRTNIFSEPSLVSCVYSQCQTGSAMIRNPGMYMLQTLVGCYPVSLVSQLVFQLVFHSPASSIAYPFSHII